MSNVASRSRSIRDLRGLVGFGGGRGGHAVTPAEEPAAAHASGGETAAPAPAPAGTGPARRTQLTRQGAGDEGGLAGEGAHGPAGPLSLGSGPGRVSGPALLHDASTTVVLASVTNARRTQNADVSPVRFPGGKNPYLDRPLPPRPPPKIVAVPPAAALVVRAATMPARPSTSHGPGSGSGSANSSSGPMLMSAFNPANGYKGPPRPNYNNEKRMSKDDMYLTGYMGRPSPDGRKKGLQPYRIGVKGGALPTPEPSPGNYYNAHATAAITSPDLSSVPARMPTPESLSSGEIPIGMAIGSPTHPPPALASWQQSQQVQQPPMQRMVAQESPLAQPPLIRQESPQSSSMPPNVVQMPSGAIGSTTVQRQKTQRRKLFGLFGRKNSEPAPTKTNSGSMDQENFGHSVSVTGGSTVSMPAFGRDGTPIRSNTVSDKKAPKHKPLVVRSNTDYGRDDRSFDSRVTGEDSDATPTSMSGTKGPSLLDVEIPDIRLERYSVMFSGLLNPPGTSSSLLARRQATLEKLKTINDPPHEELYIDDLPRPRRATSPQPTKSPAFSLFPQTPGGSTNAVAPGPVPGRLAPGPRRPSEATRTPSSSRLRSNTSPAMLPSPSRPTFEIQPQQLEPPRREKKSVTIVSPRSMDERNRAAQVERLREQQIQMARQQQQEHQHYHQPQQDQQERTFHFGPGESGLILDSPSSLGEEIIDAHPLKPALHEPQWQMVSSAAPQQVPPPPPSNASTTTKRSASVSTTASSANTHVTRPSLEIEEGDPALKAAVEISIARQISISRQQRQMLRPLQTNNLGQSAAVLSAPAGGRNGGNMSAVSPAAGVGGVRGSPVATAGGKRGVVPAVSRGDAGRVAETKFSTPTLVVPRETLDSQLAQHRKSERIVLEDS